MTHAASKNYSVFKSKSVTTPLKQLFENLLQDCHILDPVVKKVLQAQDMYHFFEELGEFIEFNSQFILEELKQLDDCSQKDDRICMSKILLEILKDFDAFLDGPILTQELIEDLLRKKESAAIYSITPLHSPEL
jgi:hypothetical protein